MMAAPLSIVSQTSLRFAATAPSKTAAFSGSSPLSSAAARTHEAAAGCCCHAELFPHLSHLGRDERALAALSSGVVKAGMRRRHARTKTTQCQASADAAEAESSSSGDSSSRRKTRVVVLGGTGRVGGSTARALVNFAADASQNLPFDLEVVVSGRNSEKGAAVASELGPSVSFAACDTNDGDALRRLIAGADLVVHTAGPFQRKETCDVLEAAIDVKTPYLDVCDDLEFSQRAKSLHSRAKAADVAAITTAGIYPGVSNLMAAEMIRQAGRGGEEEEEETKKRLKSLKYSYYTAGSGGAGPTILATSFLLLGEEVTAFRDGKVVKAKPYSGHKVVDFGPGVRSKSTYLLNLPEVLSAHQVFGVPAVSARFGTSPLFWNWAMQLMVALLPPSTLSDRSKVASLVTLSDPLVRLVDGFAGEKVAMRVDLETTDGKTAVGIFSHKQLSKSVGQCTAAFALAMLEGSTQPGVWFPEEEGGISVQARAKLLDRAARGTIRFFLSKAPWMIEKEPRYIGMGLYY